LGVSVESWAAIHAYWDRVEVPEDPSACHLWRGAVDATGEGLFRVAFGHTVPAHHFVYALAHDVAALEGTGGVAHLCGEPSCQNPDHLTVRRCAA
jgi:hypothetical protein